MYYSMNLDLVSRTIGNEFLCFMGCQASLGVSLKPTLPVTLHYISELYTSYLKNLFLNIVYHLTKPKSFPGGVRGLLVPA